MKQDERLLALAHISQLLTLVFYFGGIIGPLVIWLANKDTIYEMDQHGKQIMNFQISLYIYSLCCIPLIFLLGLGLVLMIVLIIIAFVYPISNAIKAANGKPTWYPFSISFLT